MSVYEREYELKERVHACVNGSNFQGPQVSRELVGANAVVYEHAHTHTRIFSLSSVSLRVLLYYFIPFSLSSITGILSSSLGSVRLVGNNVKMLCLSSSLWQAHARTHARTSSHAKHTCVHTKKEGKRS